MENQTISIRVEGHEVQTTAAELGFSWVNQNEIDEEVEKLSGGNLLRRYLNQKELEQLVRKIKKKMNTAAAELNFELAASLRDQMLEIRKHMNE